MDTFQHLNLLERYDRTIGIFNTLQKFVQVGDTLVDAGSGSGLLSFLSIKLGAKHVYAIERDPVIELASRLASDNNMKEKITFIRQDLKQVKEETITDAVDGLLAFVYMNDPRRDEGQHKLVFDLLDQINFKRKKLIPNRVRYSAYLASFPNHDLNNHQNHTLGRIKNLEKRYDLDFSSMLNECEKSIDFSFFPKRTNIGTYSESDKVILSSLVEWSRIDYTRNFEPYPDSVNFKMIRDGYVNSVVWVQELLYNDYVIFANESISYCRDSRFFKSGDTVSILLNDQWRSLNLIDFKK